MASPYDSNTGEGRDAEPVAGQGCGARREHIPVETPDETRQAIARIKAHFVDIERAIAQERKNPNAVALGRLGGLKSGRIRRARSARKKKLGSKEKP